jgi:hypothetical protein
MPVDKIISLPKMSKKLFSPGFGKENVQQKPSNYFKNLHVNFMYIFVFIKSNNNVINQANDSRSKTSGSG